MIRDEYSLVLIKPDGVKAGHVGEIITRIENRNFEICALKVINATEDDLNKHYVDSIGKPYFPHLLNYMTSGPMVAMIVSGTHVIDVLHKMAGATNPSDAEMGTVRGDFGREWPDDNIRNVIHTSDSIESAKREAGVWFPDFKFEA
ncbi:nucleoside-diphosphate kinase [Lactobacillus psittaci]|uniref:Nucleoside diphosphate kinase n=1 Tax=Lactobacillus psittaci DSM 15354 TaxID=1122152 RepID=A0A0R1S2Z3_9LACO|nr:nucleoside-diphosphate kinase [Lactobacillus psittaci]KRL63372.1 nucleoside diphosphate kinase [Lactobacillus psittaci DSM 15354]